MDLSFPYLDLSVNSLNLANTKIINNFQSFMKGLNYILLEQSILCNSPME